MIFKWKMDLSFYLGKNLNKFPFTYRQESTMHILTGFFFFFVCLGGGGGGFRATSNVQLDLPADVFITI